MCSASQRVMSAASSGHLTLEFGYGFGVLQGWFTSTPLANIAFSEADRAFRRDRHLGLAQRGNDAAVDVRIELIRRERTNSLATPEHGVDFAGQGAAVSGKRAVID